MTMPAQNSSKSKQDYETPPAFLQAVEARFGPIIHDVACRPENNRGRRFLADDTLVIDWSKLSGNIWCNPPFNDIATWAKKLRNDCVARPSFSFLLVPASIGTNWFAEYVHPHAMVLGLSPRLTFVGCEDPYPKDLLLAVWGFSLRGFDTWRWAT